MLLHRFLKDRRASVVPLFALSIVPIIGLIGAAVDYSRANALKASLQAAADSTALALSKTANTMDPATLQASASSYFNAVFSRPEAQNLAVTTTFTSSGGSQLVVTGSATLKTLFMGIMGFPELSVAAAGTATWGMTRLRVALVLDNTGSMTQGGSSTTPNKITALKTATKNLITQLKNAASKDGDIYVSIIPFAKDVNVGAKNYDQSWIDWTDWDAWSKNCAAQYDPTNTGQRSTAASKCGGSFTNTGTSSKPKWSWVIDHTKWNGCVTDRNQNYDTTNTPPASGALFPPEQYTACGAALMPLTYDWSALSAQVDAMTPNGSTNQTIGLVWGWQSLSPGAPLNAPPLDPNYEYQQVIILLTDGLNTQNRWNGDGSHQSTQVDNRMRLACNNAKNGKITIYAVQVNTGGDPTSTLLQDCASNKPGTLDHFFLLTSADQIITTFDTIGTNLSKLRLAK
jgi:Flp pilus assembly protein TadG